ncbi:MAG: crossover junction endodeoxyribonuclease RuvC [Halobacteria archaeon]
MGISPGTRYMGIAVFSGTELLDWGVKNIEGRWSKEKMKEAGLAISNLIERYQINVLAVKEFHPSRSSANLNQLVKGIRELARRKKLKIHQYSIKELEDFFCPEGRINKEELAELVAKRYPVLFHELNKEKANRNPYYIKMFEATALGSVCFCQLDRSRRPERN